MANDLESYIIHEPWTITAVLSLAGWLVMFVISATLTFAFVIQMRRVLSKRSTATRTVVQRTTALCKALGWLAILIGATLAWNGFSSTWKVFSTTQSTAASQGFILVCYRQATIPGFVGFLLCGFAYLQSFLIEALPVRSDT